MLRQHPAWLATGATAEVSSNCSGAGGLPLFLKDHQRSGPADVVFLVNCHRVYPTWWSVAVPRFFKMDIGWGWKCGWLCWMPPDWEKLEGQHCFRLVCQRGNNNWSTAGALKLFSCTVPGTTIFSQNLCPWNPLATVAVAHFQRIVQFYFVKT